MPAVLRLLSVLLVTCIALGAQAKPLTLPELIARARANDHRVKEAQAQLRYFRARYDEAKWAWFPKLDSYFLVAGPTPEARNDGLGGAPTTKATTMYDLDFGQPGVMMGAGADAVLPIYTFGKLDALEEAGRQGVEAGIALHTRAQDEAEYQVSQAFYGYSVARSIITVIDDTSKRLDDAEKTLNRLRTENSGQVTQMDVYKLSFYRQQAEVQRVQAENGAGFALAAIRLLVAAAPDEIIDVAAEDLSSMPEGQLAPLDSLIVRAAEHRPELKAIAAGLLAREQEVKIREAMYYPDFGIAGFFKWRWTTSATRQYSPFAYDPYNELNAGVGLVMRYQWDFPHKSIELEKARAEYEKMEHQRNLIAGGVKLELEKAYGETTLAFAKASKQGEAEKQARRWATSAFAAFELGTGDTRELVDSFSAYAQASAMKVQALYELQLGLRSLTRSVGQPVSLETRPVTAPPSMLKPK
ncbi:MAG: TolC family protein [Archangium sp.]|nr:TolC family protein [Archangium sp.]